VPTESEGADPRETSENKQSFEAQINGQAVRLVIDTGASTHLSYECAKRLHLDVMKTDHLVYGMGGSAIGEDGIASISSFKIGDRDLNRFRVITVLPRGSDIPGADGLLGLEYLHLNNAIIPVGGHGFLIRTGLTPAAPIDTYMRRLGFTPLPLKFLEGRLLINGTMNGQPLTAMIDSGASFSCFDMMYLKKVLPHDPHLINMFTTGLDGQRMLSYEFRPKELVLEGFSISPFMMVALDKPILETDKVDAFIGYDLLAKHSAVIDAGRYILWLR
jgi:predicted aspartyl protease